MAKVVKLKQSDIEKIVNNIIHENVEGVEPEFNSDEFGSEASDDDYKNKYLIKPENEELDEEGMDQENPVPPTQGGKKFYLAHDDNGVFYMVDAETNKPIGSSIPNTK